MEPPEAAVYHGDGASVGRREVLAHRPDLESVWEAVDASFPIRITRAFATRMTSWDGPLARQVLPDPRELVPEPTDLQDPVGEIARSPVPWVVHKYPDRVLLLLTKRCHLYCRFCFRRTHRPGEGLDPTPSEWDDAVRYALSCGAREAILSGGDPLAVTDERLYAAIGALAPLPVLRVHTRAPISLPARVTDDLVEVLASHRRLWVVVHTNHPDELDDAVRAALAKLVDAGIPVLNQSVLLAGVNDDVETLAALCEALVECRVFPYYLHHPDAVAGNAHFRLTVERGLEIHRALSRRLSGVALPRYVVDPPDGSGKRDVAEWGPPK